ncbi:hypothetical protein KAK06_00330 [Ideonella sp. 4Y11]|uniref:Uncharacterized protein n=1 Tax=Ideonella aquatica TaxID=2824119 RepID=A0A941BJE7_9BURK|nr:hypothetical protein [Ideonella aquatica]MBQ0957389.1 hypothetical protein [Ideonella aquatica]
MATLPDMLHAEIQRCRRVAGDCASLGSTGAFANALLEQALRDAEQALRRHEAASIEQSLERLRRYREVLPEAPSRPVSASTPVRRALPRTPMTPYWAAPREQFFTWKRAA